MNSYKSNHPCHCLFVPPHILEHMARSTDESVHKVARMSLLQDDQIRESRSSHVVDISTLRNAELGVKVPRAKTAKKKGATKVRSKATKAEVMLPPAGTAGRAVYDCNHQTRQPPAFVLERGEGDPVTDDPSVNVAYEGSGAVRDFFEDELNRNSIDNMGMNIVSNVNFGINYQNAFWNGSEMFFGNGDGTLFADFTKDLDIIGHELTHGVTQFTAALIYFSQSGALNEHFSDVFASVIEQAVDGTTTNDADWLIGDGIMGPTLFGEAIRSMKAPGTAYDNPLMGRDPQPDHMSNYYAGPRDNQGVHINSGIPNKVFYLVAMDINTDKAAQIWYTTLLKLWSRADFSDFATVLVESARLLTNSGQVPVGTTQTVRAALRSVGL